MRSPARRRLRHCSSWRRNFSIVNSTAQSFAFFRGSDEQRCRRSKTQPTRRFRLGNARFSASMDGLQNTPATSNNDVSTGGTDANGKGSSQEHHDSGIARSDCKTAFERDVRVDLLKIYPCGVPNGHFPIGERLDRFMARSVLADLVGQALLGDREHTRLQALANRLAANFESREVRAGWTI